MEQFDPVKFKKLINYLSKIEPIISPQSITLQEDMLDYIYDSTHRDEFPDYPLNDHIIEHVSYYIINAFYINTLALEKQ